MYLLRTRSILILLLISCTPFLFNLTAEDNSESSPWEKYSSGLELILEGDIGAGLVIMSEIIEEYPDSPAALRAEEIMEEYSGSLDRSGIISFYLGNMVTATWAASSIPLLFDNDDDLVLGLTGLIGIGSGIYTSWIMTRDINMSLGQDLWIEFIESAAASNIQYAFEGWGGYLNDEDLNEKLNIGTQTAATLIARGLTYNYVRDKDPSAGRIFTVINTYAWSQYYLWVSLSEIFGSENDQLNYSLAMVLPDIAAAGSYFLWEKGEWSVQRTGIISVSGLGGMLTGIFIDMIIGELFNFDPESELTSSIILGCSLAGKGLGIWATSGMKPDSGKEREKAADIGLLPLLGADSAGVQLVVRY